MAAKFSADDFRRLIQKVISPEDECVLVYSGIWTFGHRFRLDPERVPDLALDILLEVVGSSRTLMLPSYTYVYGKTRQFDLRSTPPETGILPATFLQRREVRRSHNAMSSFLIAGPLAERLVPMRGKSLWGEGSLIEWIDRNRVRIVTLGLPWAMSCGYLHRAEELALVPYRYYKAFPGQFCDEHGAWRDWSETMYVRCLDTPTVFDWKGVSDELDRRGQLLKGSVPGVFVESARADDITKATLSLLDRDPYAVLANAPAVRSWIENGGKEREVAALRSQS